MVLLMSVFFSADLFDHILFGIKEQYSLFSSPVTIIPFFPQMLLIDYIILYTKQNYSFDTSSGSVFASNLDSFR